MPDPGSLLKRAQATILDSCGQASLAQILTFCLQLSFDRIVNQRSFENQVFDLLRYAKRHHILGKLFDCLAKVSPEKTDLANHFSKLKKPPDEARSPFISPHTPARQIATSTLTPSLVATVS